MKRKPTIIITNNSGDISTRTYNTDSEAEILFMSSLFRCGMKAEFIPSTGNWKYTWERTCGSAIVNMERITKE